MGAALINAVLRGENDSRALANGALSKRRRIAKNRAVSRVMQ